MGNKYEIYLWLWNERLEGYDYEQVWAGESREDAFAELNRLIDANAAGCVKLECRDQRD